MRPNVTRITGIVTRCCQSMVIEKVDLQNKGVTVMFLASQSTITLVTSGFIVWAATLATMLPY